MFFRLGALEPGEQVSITPADRQVAVFRITAVRLYLKDQFPTSTVYGNTDYAALRLITCGAASMSGSFRLMPHAALSGTEISYADTGGDGLVVVLSHGFLMDQSMFAPQVKALAPEFRVMTWDQRGHGWDQGSHGGTLARGPFSYWDSARDLLALLDHLGVQRAVLGGMSQGGFVSLRAALLAPGRVRGLILIDTEAGKEDPAVAPAYEQLHEVWRVQGPGPVQEVVSSIIWALASGTTGTPSGPLPTSSSSRSGSAA